MVMVLKVMTVLVIFFFIHYIPYIEVRVLLCLYSIVSELINGLALSSAFSFS